MERDVERAREKERHTQWESVCEKKKEKKKINPSGSIHHKPCPFPRPHLLYAPKSKVHAPMTETVTSPLLLPHLLPYFPTDHPVPSDLSSHPTIHR